MARKDAEEGFLSYLDELAPGTQNRIIYEDIFKSLSDKDFHKLYLRIRDEEFILPVYFENMNDEVDIERVMDIGERLGYNWFQRLRVTDHITGDVDLTPKEYPVFYLFGRRQIQHLRDKIALPSTDAKRNHLTGQATGESKGASITAPELQVLDDKGLSFTIEEMIKNRGGDDEAYLETLRSLEETGKTSLQATRNLGSKPQASETLRALFLSILLDNTVGV